MIMKTFALPQYAIRILLTRNRRYVTMCRLRFRLLLPAMAVLLAGCATTRQPFTDGSITVERKAFVTCAAYKAYALSNSQAPVMELAQSAVGQCSSEKAAVLAKLNEENAQKPGAQNFAAAYVEQMQSTMVSHIAAKLTQVRAIKRARESDEDNPRSGKRI
jgi:hypothetical protein